MGNCLLIAGNLASRVKFHYMADTSFRASEDTPDLCLLWVLSFTVEFTVQVSEAVLEEDSGGLNTGKLHFF